MIITQLNGGLGNQMFQYALAKVLATQNNDDLYLDLSPFTDTKNGDTPRTYGLSIFGINNPECSTYDRIRLGDENPILKMINRTLGTSFDTTPSSLVKERQHAFDPKVLELKGDLYLRGFWQSEKYFLKYRDLILETFSFKKKLSKKSVELLKKIEIRNSISVHVRRGDYANNPSTKKYHGLCGLGYYRRAVALIKKLSINPTYFVFSDDPEWCKSNLELPGKTIFVSHNKGSHSWEDMRLMSACKHHIIANSSFSWWGAWLSRYPDKIVIAPKKWVADPRVQMPDIIPEGWVTI